MKLLEYLLSRPLMVTPEAAEAAAEYLARREFDPEFVAVKPGRQSSNARTMTVRDGVAIIPVVGPVFRYADVMTTLCGGTTTEELAYDLETAMSDPSIRGILWNFDTPGGEATGIPELAALIREASKVKPSIGYAGDHALSAGYFLGSATSRVVINEAGFVGSIGTVVGISSKADPKLITFVSSQSPRKRSDPTTIEGADQYQQIADDMAAIFIGHVAANRGVSVEKVLSDFGQGGRLMGAKAVAAGMADAVGTFEQSLADLSNGTVPLRKSKAKNGGDPTTTEEDMGFPKMFTFSKRTDGSYAVEVPEPNPPATPPPATTTEQLPPIANKEAADAAHAAQLVAMQARIDAAEKYAAEQFLKTATSEAGAFTMALLSSNRIIPAQRTKLNDALIRAALDDHAYPPATGETSRVGAIQAMFVDALPHTLTQERIDPNGHAPALAGTIPSQRAGTRNDETTPEAVANGLRLLEEAGVIGPLAKN